MPMYRWNGTQWVQYVSTSLTTGTNVYVKTAGTTGGMTTTNSNRVRDIYMHNGTSWAKVYKGFIPAPPSAPATPGSFNFGSGYLSKITYTTFQWSSVALPAGASRMDYILEIWNASKTALVGTVTKTHTSHPVTVTSGTVFIPTEGVTQYYRVKARAYNSIGTYTDSGTSGWKGLKSGSVLGSSYFNTTGNIPLVDGVLFDVFAGSGTNPGADVYTPGVTTVDRTTFFIAQNRVISPPSDPLVSTISVAGPGGFDAVLTDYYTPSGVQSPGISVSDQSMSEVGRFKWTINPISGWGPSNDSYGYIKISSYGYKTTSSSVVT